MWIATIRCLVDLVERAQGVFDDPGAIIDGDALGACAEGRDGIDRVLIEIHDNSSVRSRMLGTTIGARTTSSEGARTRLPFANSGSR